MSETTKGTAVVPAASAARYTTRQLTGLLGRDTALTWASHEGYMPLVEHLIAAGAALDVQSNEGYGPRVDCPRPVDRSTARILAAMQGHTLVVKQLIAAGAALDVQENYG